MKSKFFRSLALMFALEINEPQPEGASATEPETEDEHDATPENTPMAGETTPGETVTAEPGTEGVAQSAAADDSE
jgi:hypothetical protein